MKRSADWKMVRLMAMLVIIAAGMAAGSGMAPAQHAPCNPAVETCL